ncbi:Hypothetical protein BRZCDTV_269 [Brazilian cedratvirus IHUMI]|uniref:Uncharacterized protein n=1 Tax=Brazilian cedratvirus IHUMI TaxID=2126980 RepID=A0A2R8FEB4_9VIRU|nr:Hypothetical protein BRZCDTV_269 [Brazilian cedratvirus IHUMI]
MLPVYSAILVHHEEPKEMQQVCSLFLNILSNKGFWKERHEREGLPYIEHKLSPLRVYYLTRKFVKQETPLSCHLSELPFFPSFASGEEYYARAIKFRREEVSESINLLLLHRCTCYYNRGHEGWLIKYEYNSFKANIDKMITAMETAMGVKDPEHPSLDVNVKMFRTEFGNYNFYLYLNLDDEEGNKVEVPIESTLIDTEQALSFYLSSV